MRPPKFRFDWRYFGKRLARETLVTARKNAVVSVVAIAVTLGLRGYSFTGERTPAQSTPVAPKAPASKIIDRELLLTGPKADLDRLRASFPAGSKRART